MSTAPLSQPNSFVAVLPARVLAGVLGGLAGGIAFGILMATMGMLPMVAALVGSSAPWIGIAVHLVISVGFGLAFTVPFAGLFLRSYGIATLAGLGYGVFWWVFGPLVIMPAMLGMPLFMVDVMSLFSLMGHLVYGVLLALVAARVLKGRRV
ncbi:hypothetical protein J7E25_14380 [Agromyces sp. ISL-38]|uniref:hypothetical protein n=1 Tax=Agromyces sp. ISL-38 TaxID=2819107 RepID=UPI001BE9E38D|nr:hypothetical protein [Agromyces sp. ISL-38]MBT2500278.1 hypothetical protein [Agromyces sp. ISL-38]